MNDLSPEQISRLRELSVQIENKKDEALAREMFSIFDRNHNGTIELREFVSGMVQVLNEDLPDLEWVQIFKSIDTNRDGALEFEEFLSWLTQDPSE